VSRRCIAVLGGSFDPVHNGHVALAQHFIKLLSPDELRLIPAGNPWQKEGLKATPAHRIAMLKLAFRECPVPVVIDTSEIERDGPTYTIDTLRALREKSGQEASIAFLIGADQLQGLNTWKQWRQLFDYAHFCIASRPEFGIGASVLAQDILGEISQRQCKPEEIRETASGSICIAEGLAVEVSSTQVRNALKQGEQINTWLPPAVLDYIKQHHLYGN
jgi:nicotinate-nucleotide adenylyltransferase